MSDVMYASKLVLRQKHLSTDIYASHRLYLHTTRILPSFHLLQRHPLFWALHGVLAFLWDPTFPSSIFVHDILRGALCLMALDHGLSSSQR